MVKSATEIVQDLQVTSPTIDKEELHSKIDFATTTLHSDNDMFIGSLSAHLNQAHNDDLNIAEIIKANRYVLLSCESLLQSYGKWGKSMIG